MIEYLKTPPSLAMLEQLIERAGLTPRGLLRTKGSLATELGLDHDGVSDAAILDAMVGHPALIERPIVVTPLGVRLCRPADKVREILPA